MPNHITTRIKITGDPEAVKRVLNKIKKDEFGMGTIDFEKIIPMPKNIFKGNLWFCQYHLTHFIRTRIMQRERYDHSRAFFELPEAAHRWRCRFFC